jgi:DNA-binding transcriptional ArsR family regulator
MRDETNGKNIDKRILEYLSKLPLTATTEMVAKELGIAWYTAQMHLIKLRDEGKIKLYRIGRQNQWILSFRTEKMKYVKFRI